MKHATAIFPEGRQAVFEKFGYSPAVRCGDFVLVSGQVGVDANGEVVEDAEAQIRLAFTKLSDMLNAVGASLADVVEVHSYHVDLDQHEEAFHRARREFFPDPPFPAMTGLIEVSRLGMLGLIVEVSAVAYLGSSERSR